MRGKVTIIRSGLEALYFSGLHHLLRPLWGGVGAILMLHHVRPPRADPFQPNRHLEVTPEFLTSVVRQIASWGIDFVSLDEMYRRLTEQDFRRRFVCITFDDGYRDNKMWAYPILKAQGVPFAIYVPTSFPDRHGQLWWVALEEIVARQDRIVIAIDGHEIRIDSTEISDKWAAFERIYEWLRRRPTEAEALGIVRELAIRYGVDMNAICERLCMSWGELAELAADPLVTIGAHTVNHVMLSKASPEVVRGELSLGRSGLETQLGIVPHHLAYPYGDRETVGQREFHIAAELGFRTAVTTRPGVLFAAHREHLTALPRISLNGEYQRNRYVRVLLSGAATALWNGFRRVNAA